MHSMSINFGVDSLSLSPFRLWAKSQTYKVTDATDHPNHGSAIASMGNKLQYASDNINQVYRTSDKWANTD